MLTHQIDVFHVKECQETKDWFESQTESVQLSIGAGRPAILDKSATAEFDFPGVAE